MTKLIKLAWQTALENLAWLRSADFRKHSLGRFQIIVGSSAIVTLVVAMRLGGDFTSTSDLVSYYAVLSSVFVTSLAIGSVIQMMLPNFALDDVDELGRRSKIAVTLAIIISILCFITLVCLFLCF